MTTDQPNEEPLTFTSARQSIDYMSPLIEQRNQLQATKVRSADDDKRLHDLERQIGRGYVAIGAFLGRTISDIRKLQVEMDKITERLEPYFPSDQVNKLRERERLVSDALGGVMDTDPSRGR